MKEGDEGAQPPSPALKGLHLSPRSVNFLEVKGYCGGNTSFEDKMLQ